MTLGAPAAWAVISACLLILTAAGLSWQIVRLQLSPARKCLTVLGQWLAAACLWLLLVQPQRQAVEGPGTVLLTPGSSATEGAGVVRLAGLDLYPLLKGAPRATRVEVRGHGLPLEQWRGTSASLEFNPAPLPAGLLDVSWPRRLVLGQELTVSARVHDLPQAREAVLLAPGDVELESVSLGGSDTFSLSVLPPASGPLLLQLELRDAAGSALLREPLPVLLEPPQGPRVLIALARLNFEARDLQRWLAGSSPGIRLQSRVGTRVQRILTGGEAPPPDGAWQSEPEKLDLVVVDSAWLGQLGSAEITRLARAVAGGLGLLVLADEQLLELRDGPLLRGFVLDRYASGKASVRLEQQTFELQRAEVRAGAGRVELADSGGEPLIVSRPLGAGTVALSLLRDSYTLNTRGQQVLYASLWRRVTAAVARPQPSDQWVQAALPIMQAGESVRRCDDAGCRRRVLEAEGWNELDGVGHFAFSDEHWRAYRAQALQQQTAAATALRSVGGRQAASAAPWPPAGLLWLLFVLTAGLLWLEQKFR